MSLANTLLAHNSGSNDCANTGELIDGGGNLASGGLCGLPTATVALGPLTDNGGSTLTLAIPLDGLAVNRRSMDFR